MKNKQKGSILVNVIIIIVAVVVVGFAIYGFSKKKTELPIQSPNEISQNIEQKLFSDFSFSGNDLFYKTDKIVTIQPTNPQCKKYNFSIPTDKGYMSSDGRYLIINGECSGGFLPGKEIDGMGDPDIYNALVDTSEKIKITDMFFGWGSDQLHFSTFINNNYILASQGEIKGSKRDFVLKAFDIQNKKYIELKRIENIKVVTWPMNIDSLSSNEFITFNIWVGNNNKDGSENTIDSSTSRFNKIKLNSKEEYQLNFKLNKNNLSLEII